MLLLPRALVSYVSVNICCASGIPRAGDCSKISHHGLYVVTSENDCRCVRCVEGIVLVGPVCGALKIQYEAGDEDGRDAEEGD